MGQKKKKKQRKRYADKAYRQAKNHKNNAKTIKSILENNNYNGVKLTFKDRKILEKQYENAVNGGKHWMNTRKDILSMDLSQVNIKDIKKRFDEDKYKYGYYPL